MGHSAVWSTRSTWAVGIVSPLESLPAEGHRQVFGVFPKQLGHYLAVEFSRALLVPIVRGDAHDA